MDYTLPLLVLLLVFRPTLPLAAKILLATMVLLSLIVTIKTYRVSIDGHNLYLNNLFITQTIDIKTIKKIEPAPFYYGATSGRVSEKGFRIVFDKQNRLRKIVVLVSKKKEVQALWDQLNTKVESKNKLNLV